jgi:methionyl-tRNA formyltransferase
MADGSAAKVLFFGMTGTFSLPPLEALLKAGVQVVGVVVPGAATKLVQPPAHSGGLPILTPYARRSIVHLAWEHGIPVHEVSSFDTLDVQADLIAVACFDRLVPRRIRARAKLAVNIHPSLLPDNRGPAPLFWTFRLGQPETGVTIHLLEDKADAGAILAQTQVRIPDEMDGAELEQRLAGLGGELLIEVIHSFEAGRLHPVPQDEARASSHPWPSAEDWAIPAGWPEQRVRNFVRGVAHLRPDS